MLIRFFKYSFIAQYFALILLVAAIWAPAFWKPVIPPEEPALTAPLYHLIWRFVSLAPFLSPLTSVIIILGSALALNHILIHHDLSPKNNLLPAFIFIILTGNNPVTMGFYPVMLTLPLFVWFLHSLYRVNDEPENFMQVFNACMILAFITLIIPSMVILMLMVWLLLLVFGTFNGRNLVISFAGFFLPYLYLAVYYFWADRLPDAGDAYAGYFLRIFNLDFPVDYLQMMIWSWFFLLMFFPAFFRVTSTLSTFSINFRKKMAATAWFLFFTLILIPLSGPWELNTLLFLPAGIMIAHYYNLFRKQIWNEIVVLVYVALVIIHHYLVLANVAPVF